MVARVLVLTSYFPSNVMAFSHDPCMLMSLAAATVIASAAPQDGETNWLEGTMFLAVYIFFALIFWFHPWSALWPEHPSNGRLERITRGQGRGNIVAATAANVGECV